MLGRQEYYEQCNLSHTIAELSSFQQTRLYTGLGCRFLFPVESRLSQVLIYSNSVAGSYDLLQFDLSLLRSGPTNRLY